MLRCRYFRFPAISLPPLQNVSRPDDLLLLCAEIAVGCLHSPLAVRSDTYDLRIPPCAVLLAESDSPPPLRSHPALSLQFAASLRYLPPITTLPARSRHSDDPSLPVSFRSGR